MGSVCGPNYLEIQRFLYSAITRPLPLLTRVDFRRRLLGQKSKEHENGWVGLKKGTANSGLQTHKHLPTLELALPPKHGSREHFRKFAFALELRLRHGRHSNASDGD